MYFPKSHYGETGAKEWTEALRLNFPDALDHDHPYSGWRKKANWYTLKIGPVIVAIGSYYGDGLWKIWPSEENYNDPSFDPLIGEFACDYAEINDESWYRLLEEIENFQ